ncbi:MAG: 3-oxoadipate enol-lactonase [Terriglobales bacterium]
MPFANCRGLRTHYELSGESGPVLVFSNSLGTDLSMWEPQMPDLVPRFRILRYDTRGHGQTSVTPGDYTIEQLGRDVLNLLDALNLPCVHFCGLSMGGMIGIWLGANAPERLHRLVLSNTAARIGTKEVWNDRIAAVLKDGMAPVAAAVIERWFTPEFRAAKPERVAKTRRMLESSPPQGYASCCAGIRDMDQTADIAKITVPTLIIYGAKDPVTSPTDADFLTSHICGATSLKLEAAHLSNVEQDAAFTASLLRFLAA